MIPSPDQLQIRDTVRAFAREQLAPHAAAWDRESRFPAEAVRAMGELGLFGMLAPEASGGTEAGAVAYALAVEEIAAGDGACSTIMSVQNSLVCGPLAAFGTPAQKERFLAPVARGAMLGAFALTEPQAGSDASSLATRARRDGHDWVLHGAKQFITCGKTAAFAIVFAVTDPDARSRGITAFLVPTDAPGYRVVRLEDKLGQRASDTCQIALDDVRVPDGNRLGIEGEGYRIALANLAGGRIGIAAQAVGMARAAFECARDYARERRSFGRPLVEHQAVAFRLADMASEIQAARQMVLHAAALSDAGRPSVTTASMAKLLASEMAERVASGAIQTLGGYGYVEGLPAERIWRDVRVCQIYEGASDIQRLLIARDLDTAADLA